MEMFNECEFNQLEAEIIYCNTAAVLFLKNDLVQHFEKCLCFFFFFFARSCAQTLPFPYREALSHLLMYL